MAGVFNLSDSAGHINNFNDARVTLHKNPVINGTGWQTVVLESMPHINALMPKGMTQK
jgi:hypothetical protein